MFKTQKWPNFEATHQNSIFCTIGEQIQVVLLSYINSIISHFFSNFHFRNASKMLNVSGTQKTRQLVTVAKKIIINTKPTHKKIRTKLHHFLVFRKKYEFFKTKSVVKYKQSLPLSLSLLFFPADFSLSCWFQTYGTQQNAVIVFTR